MTKRRLRRRFDMDKPPGRGFGKGFIAGGILGMTIGVAAFALVPALGNL